MQYWTELTLTTTNAVWYDNIKNKYFLYYNN